jgi:hypothetical protein
MEYNPSLILPAALDFCWGEAELLAWASATLPSIAAPAAAPDVSMNFLRFMVLII